MDQPNLHKNEMLPVMEHFYTLQGEGFFSGHAAYFIRLGGCDVGCVWCDVKDSWDAEKHPLFSSLQLVEIASEYPSRMVVITGGEPSMYDLTNLTEEFIKAGFNVHIETAGTNELKGHYDWITFSPKKFKEPVEQAIKSANELKVIVYNKSDFDWAEKYAAFVNTDCFLYLQPEWEKREIVTPLIIEYVKSNPEWKISLQTHKYLQIP